MEQLCERKDELLKKLELCIEERFLESCQVLQKIIDTSAEKIWDDFCSKISSALQDTRKLQLQNRKGSIQYLLFTFMQYSTWINRLELCISVLDDGFYLDEEDVKQYYVPDFLQGRYLEDIEYFYAKARESMVRLQDYELQEINIYYSDFYNSILYKLVSTMKDEIIELVMDSGISVTDRFMIIYGEYMGEGTIL